MAARISPRLRRVLDIARRSRLMPTAPDRAWDFGSAEWAERERLLWAEYKRQWNIPDDVTPESGGWF